MRRFALAIAAASCITFVTSPASYAKCVVIVGDSLSAANPAYNPPTSDWPALLRARRPDVTTCNISIAGRTTFGALAQFDNTMTWIRQTHVVTDVVVLLGVNDFRLYCSPAYETAGRLRQLAWKIENTWGARAWIMTPPPATNSQVCSGVALMDFTNDVESALHTLGGIGPDEYTVTDLRDQFARNLAWSDPDCQVDGIHPKLTGRHLIADFVASWLPQQ